MSYIPQPATTVVSHAFVAQAVLVAVDPERELGVVTWGNSEGVQTGRLTAPLSSFTVLGQRQR